MELKDQTDMDVLKPSLIWLQGRCYRKDFITKDDNEYVDDMGKNYEECDMYEDESCDSCLPIVESDSGFKLSLNVPSAYFKFIIGKKGETLRRLEQETRAQIRLPRQGDDGPIVISSRERKGVISANTRIELLIDSARTKIPFTHFISIPITARNIQDHFIDFKNDVLRSCDGDRGLDISLFQNPTKLHLTLGTLVLLDDDEVRKATDVLLSLKEKIIDPVLNGRPLMVFVNGLEYMNDDPNEVDVLYAKVEIADGSDRLQMLTDRIVDSFVTAGLVQREFDRLKLHATVMNTLFRKDPSGASSVRVEKKPRESFDASNVLRLFGDYDFNMLKIGEVHLSERYSTGDDGYYKPAAKVYLP
ncbi:activating signal cointegrator 1 complex subunit 1-like [Tubulanus polymorphus]|uniref:activating signal cointegrator 1 complex subunit 1-like n=1 Tax=Tubulanus polymorphus TaxID=672921 RepID=UPI003DA6CAE8